MRVLTSSACLLWGMAGATAAGQGCQPAGGLAGNEPGVHFPSGYQEARESFLKASRAAGAVVESIRSPHAGPDGQALFIDVSLVGPGDGKSVLLLISGTHGIEGFAGSAIQTGLLREWDDDRDRDVSVLLVHALNPYGFAHLRRFNEDNVDLNRNFVDHSLPYKENLRYGELEGSISPESTSFLANTSSFLNLMWYRVKYGKAALKEAVTLGQHSDPDGLFYGGRSETWSNRTLRSIVDRYLSAAKRVTSVEIHTGLGPFGEAEIILGEASNSPACRRARAWWGALAKSTRSADSVSANIRGSVKLALPAMLPAAEVTAVSLEFGTYSAAKVLRSLQAENWLHHHGGGEHPDALKIKADLLEAFYPAGSEWREQVWMRGREVIGQTLAGLSREVATPAKKFLPGAEPLYLQGGDRGLLLLHGGGGGTAWDMKEFASAAHRRGHTVWVPSLPGYGTQPADLIGITAEAWLDEARDGVDRLLRECDTVAVAGHSMGGVLALLLAAEDGRISRVAAWAPPWKIRNRLLPLLPVVSRVPLARRLIPERLPVETPKRLKEMGWVGYEWLPGSTGLPVLDSLKRLHGSVGDISCPVLVVQGTEDEVVARESAREIFSRLPGPSRHMRLIEGGTHVLMLGPFKDDLFRETLDFLE